MRARELSDESLLHELAGFLSYEARGGRLDFDAWVATKDFAPGDADFLRVAWMGATMGLVS